jgi:ATP-dependent Clp protease ATP-binding subunit ClpA
MKILCDALELRCPMHGDIVHGISSTVLWCRSGLTRRIRKQQPTSSSSSPTTTWLLFRGRDAGGKTAIALELAKLVFGSYAEFTALQAASSDKPTHSAKLTLKRQRSAGDGNGDYAGPRLFEAIRENPHRVILIEDVDGLDHDSEMRIKDARSWQGR